MHMFEKTIIGCIKDLQINSIRLFKDEEFQRKIWFFKNEEPTIVSSYCDATLHFIDGCRYIFKQPSSSDFIGKENYELLKNLYDLVLDHLHTVENKCEGDPDLLGEDELLNDPKWHDIQTLAGEVDLKLTEFVKRKENG